MVKRSLLAAVAVTLCAVPALAATVAASTAFSTVYGGGTDANYTFGYAPSTALSSLPAAPTAFTNQSLIQAAPGDPAHGIKGLYNNTVDFTPGVFLNDSASTVVAAGTVTLAAGQLAMHPGVGGEYSVIQYLNTGAAGSFALNALFTSSAANPPATTDIHLRKTGGTSDLAGGAFSPSTSTVDLSGNYFLDAGESLFIYVGFGTGGYGSDTSALLNGGVTVQAVPLPTAAASGATLLAGLALGARRRK